MAITATTVNLSDPFSTFVNKTNALVTDAGNLDSSIGLLSSLNTDDKSSLVAAVNEIQQGNVDFQSDSAGGILFDSDQRSFSIAPNTITSSFFKNVEILLVKDASGSTLKTMYSPGS